MKRHWALLTILFLSFFLLTPGGSRAEGSCTDLYLPSDPDTGSWEYVLEDESILGVEWAYYEDIHDLGLIGNAGAEWFRISGLAEGSTTLKLLFINRFTLHTDMTLVYRINVDENLNVLIWGFEMLEAETAPRGEITSLFFTFGGYERPVTWSYRKLEDGTFVKEVDDFGEQPVSQEFRDRLNQLAEQYEIRSWNGFNETSEGILDGEDFLFSMVYENGFPVEASGSNRFPEHYSEFQDALRDLFEEE